MTTSPAEEHVDAVGAGRYAAGPGAAGSRP